MKNKGITLIALVITIIVLLILAGVSISTITGENGIVQKAKEAKEKTEKAEKDEMKSLGGLEEYINDETEENEEKPENPVVPEEPEIPEEPEVSENLEVPVDHNGPTIPEGATYYVGIPEEAFLEGRYEEAEFIYNSGDEFPEILNVGDVYVYGDYEYCYQSEMCETDKMWDVICGDRYGDEPDGWAVLCVNDVAEPGIICESINGEPVESMAYAFCFCENLTTSPTIPDSIIDMSGTFENCVNLIEAPEIPSSVISMINTFHGCSALTGTIIINTNNITTTEHEWSGSCSDCFYGVDMGNITLTGSASKDVLNLIGSTGDNWTPIP